MQELGSNRVDGDPRWSTAHKVGFRFAFVYLCLYLYPFSSTLGWYWSIWLRWGYHETPWQQLVPWVAEHVLRIGHPVAPSPLSDSLYLNVKVLCLALIAGLVTVIWSIADRERPAYPKLNQWIRWWVRLVLALTMIGFGASKIYPTQAPPPDLVTLMQSYGDIGPNRFFWASLGASRQYQSFAAVLETLSGVLLLVPGMATAGALLALGALIAVFTQAGFYGVPDKLVQAHLILLAAFVVLPDVPRLLNVIVFNRGTKPEPRPPLVQQRWLNASLWGAQWVLGAYLVVHLIVQGRTMLEGFTSIPTTTPLYGIWRVDEFVADGQTLPPVLTDSVRWNRVIFDRSAGIPGRGIPPVLITTIQDLRGRFLPYIASMDTTKGTLALRSPSAADLGGLARLWIHTDVVEGSAQLNYKRVSPDTVVLDGIANGHRVLMTLSRERREFALQKLRFHWIIDEKDIAY